MLETLNNVSHTRILLVIKVMELKQILKDGEDGLAVYCNNSHFVDIFMTTDNALLEALNGIICDSGNNTINNTLYTVLSNTFIKGLFQVVFSW